MRLHHSGTTGRLGTALLGMLGLGLGALLAAACGSDINDFPGCDAGQSQACTGPMGCQGFQVCADDGTKFEPCDCGTGSGGGSSNGSGGMTSSSSGATGGSGGNATTTSGGGGMGGMTGTGGMGGNPNPDGCPPQTPMDNGSCMGGGIGSEPIVCDYGDTTCSCGALNTWNCYMCPAQEPQGVCSDFGAQCNYGDTTCNCNGIWTCQTCPQMQPMGACSGQATCQYGNVTCYCFGNSWNCF